MDRNQFTRFEKRVRLLIEGSFARLFAGQLQPREVAVELVRAMEERTVTDTRGQPIAPNRYAVHLHPGEREVLLSAQPDLTAQLAEHLVRLAQDGGLRLDTAPEVILVPDARIMPHGVAVQAEFAPEVRQTTQLMQPLPADDAPSDGSRDSRLPPAFLVVDGGRYVPLDRTVINVGRRRDNAIVLDDPRVSRQHCQLRFRFGDFVLYDLGSRGGTFVNNERITECVLKPGDVLSLAGVQMVYMIDEATTGQFRKPSSDTNVRLDSVTDERHPPDGLPEDDAGGF